MSANLAAVLYALGAALFFGMMPICMNRGVVVIGAQAGALVTIGTATAVYTFSAPLWMHAEYFASPALWVFLANGLIHPTASMYMAYESTRRIGPTVATTFAATTPLWAAGMAIAFLGERLDWLTGIGTVAAVVGVMILAWRGRRIPKLVAGALLLATGAAWVRAVSQVVGSWGLDMLPEPMMAAWASFTLAFAVSLSAYSVRMGKLPLGLPRRGIAWCTASGVFCSIAIYCMYTSLEIGPVVVVAPVIALNPAFTLFFALAFRQETLGARVMLGVAVALTGVVLVTIA